MYGRRQMYAGVQKHRREMRLVTLMYICVFHPLQLTATCQLPHGPWSVHLSNTSVTLSLQFNCDCSSCSPANLELLPTSDTDAYHIRSAGWSLHAGQPQSCLPSPQSSCSGSQRSQPHLPSPLQSSCPCALRSSWPPAARPSAWQSPSLFPQSALPSPRSSSCMWSSYLWSGNRCSNSLVSGSPSHIIVSER